MTSEPPRRRLWLTVKRRDQSRSRSRPARMWTVNKNYYVEVNVRQKDTQGYEGRLTDARKSDARSSSNGDIIVLCQKLKPRTTVHFYKIYTSKTVSSILYA